MVKIWLLKISKKHLILQLLNLNIAFWLYIASKKMLGPLTPDLNVAEWSRPFTQHNGQELDDSAARFVSVMFSIFSLFHFFCLHASTRRAPTILMRVKKTKTKRQRQQHNSYAVFQIFCLLRNLTKAPIILGPQQLPPVSSSPVE